MAINTTYNGYFLPQSMSYDYVRGKRNELGVNKWDYEANEINIDKQRALQNLNDRYSESLNDAYANYLASQGLIQNSNMGQGYQQQYSNQLANQFNQTATELGTSVSEAKSQVEANTQARLDASQSALETQVANLNRVGTLAENYLNYVKTLRNTNSDNASDYFYGDTGLTENATIEDLYARMLGDENGMDTTLAAGYKDIENNVAKSFSQYVNDEMTDKDQDFYNWFLASGYNDFKSGIKDKVNQYMSDKRENADSSAINSALQNGEYKDYQTGSVLKIDKSGKITIDDTKIGTILSRDIENKTSVDINIGGKNHTLSIKDGKYLIDGKDYKSQLDNSYVKFTNRGISEDVTFEYNGKEYGPKNYARVDSGSTLGRKITKYLSTLPDTIDNGKVFEYDGNTYAKGKYSEYYKLKN